jgi:hypothetical protein
MAYIVEHQVQFLNTEDQWNQHRLHHKSSEIDFEEYYERKKNEITIK